VLAKKKVFPPAKGAGGLEESSGYMSFYGGLGRMFLMKQSQSEGEQKGLVVCFAASLEMNSKKN
jgi:hypothetical protein